MMLMTLGYEGLSVEEFFSLLKKSDVQVIVDVRELPLSRKRGFSKASMAKLAAENGLTYIHMRALGCPKEIRNDYRCDKDWGRYTQRFMNYLASQEGAVGELIDLLKIGRCCLICFEEDPRFCHRSYVAQAVAKKVRNPSLIHHLFKKGKVGSLEPALA